MKSWINRNSSASRLAAGDTLGFQISTHGHGIAVQDLVFVVDRANPAVLHGWGKVSEVSRLERLVVGDDEEANTEPYPTYDILDVEVVCAQAFVLPLSLSDYLSLEDFEAYEDEYGNQYEDGIQELSALLADRLNQAIGYRRRAGAPVFLSYAREDLDLAMRLSERLSTRGFHVWTDWDSLVGGQAWRREITNAIRISRAFIALLSNSSITKRGFVQREVRIGLEVLSEVPPSQIYLIPVRKEPCVPDHEALNDLQWIDLFPDFERGFEALVSAIDAT